MRHSFQWQENVFPFQEFDVIANFHAKCTVLVENMYILYVYSSL